MRKLFGQSCGSEERKWKNTRERRRKALLFFYLNRTAKKNRVTYGDSVKKREFKQVRQGMSMKKLLN